mgnify:CR=1 FL=1
MIFKIWSLHLIYECSYSWVDECNTIGLSIMSHSIKKKNYIAIHWEVKHISGNCYEVWIDGCLKLYFWFVLKRKNLMFNINSPEVYNREDFFF